jgi:hypothetical protein
MAEYHVTWTIEIDADSHEDAARKAQAIQRKPNSTANVFTVSVHSDPDDEEEIDLDEEIPWDA